MTKTSHRTRPRRMLTRLKLTAIRDQLDSLLDEAGRGASCTLREALALLCEARDRAQGRATHRDGPARSPSSRSCARWRASTSTPSPRSIRSRSANWPPAAGSANGDSVLLLGPPGVGKTHLAVALGREAIRARLLGAVRLGAHALVTQLAKAQPSGRLEERLRTTPSRSC